MAAERYEEAAQELDALDMLRLRIRSLNVLQNQERRSKILYQPGTHWSTPQNYGHSKSASFAGKAINCMLQTWLPMCSLRNVNRAVE